MGTNVQFPIENIIGQLRETAFLVHLGAKISKFDTTLVDAILLKPLEGENQTGHKQSLL